MQLTWLAKLACFVTCLSLSQCEVGNCHSFCVWTALCSWTLCSSIRKTGRGSLTISCRFYHFTSFCDIVMYFFFLSFFSHGAKCSWIHDWNLSPLAFVLLQRLRESDDRRFDEVSSEIELLLAEGSEISEPSLCAVAALGNFEILQQLLSKGMDVDKTDYCGRTALVCPSNP